VVPPTRKGHRGVECSGGRGPLRVCRRPRRAGLRGCPENACRRSLGGGCGRWPRHAGPGGAAVIAGKATSPRRLTQLVWPRRLPVTPTSSSAPMANIGEPWKRVMQPDRNHRQDRRAQLDTGNHATCLLGLSRAQRLLPICAKNDSASTQAQGYGPGKNRRGKTASIDLSPRPTASIDLSPRPGGTLVAPAWTKTPLANV
jgi:hypothetical protein